jgi:hypothetical protein
MSARREGKGKGQGTAANEAATAMNNGVGHGRLGSTAIPQKHLQNPPASRASVRPSVIPNLMHERLSSICQQQSDATLHNEDDGSTREPPTRRQRRDLHRCCDCFRSSTCALSRPTARSLACLCRVANIRCTSCACFNSCQNKRALLPPQTTATPR